MTSDLKIHLFKVRQQDDSQSLEDVLHLAVTDALVDRLRICNRQDVRLESAQEPTNQQPYLLLDFSNLRFSAGPLAVEAARHQHKVLILEKTKRFRKKRLLYTRNLHNLNILESLEFEG